MARNSIVRIEKVYKTYTIGKKALPILKNINLEIDRGEFVAFMGPSGSGKSTLLHLLGGLDKPTQGHIYLEGVDVGGMDDESLAHLRSQLIGFVFQSFFLLPYFNALQNVSLPLIYSTKKQSSPQLGEKLLESVGLGERMEHRPNELSGGERQRVAIARALINNPSILCADEPTGNLDSKNGAVIMQYLKDINQRGTTVILITHDSEIARQAGRIIKIQDGEIV